MELRTLRYFLALVQEGTVSGAANFLHVTQPTLSRQLSELEREFDTQLFERGPKRIRLTDAGARLHAHAKDIVTLADKAVADLMQGDQGVSGDVYIGCGEADSIRYIQRAVKHCRAQHPRVHFHLFSGTSSDLIDRFESGVFDFMVEFEFAGRWDCDALRLPALEEWGILMRRDSPLASRRAICPDDLLGVPLIGSWQGMQTEKLQSWAGDTFDKFDVVMTYNLIGNGALGVEEGVGVAFAYSQIVRVDEEGPLTFRPLDPPLQSDVGVIWKKHRQLSRAAQAFLAALKAECGCPEDGDSRA